MTVRYRVRCLVCGWTGVRRPAECEDYECWHSNHVSWPCPKCQSRFYMRVTPVRQRQARRLASDAPLLTDLEVA